MEVISYNNIINTTKTQKDNSTLDINAPNYLYNFVDALLKNELKKFKQGNLKPFKLSQTRNIITIQFPTTYDLSLYDKWYTTIEHVVNKVFYRKESENDVVPDSYQRNRLFTLFNSEEYEINGNVVIKSIPIYQPKSKTKNAKSTISDENKEAIVNKGKLSNPKKKCMYVADESSDEDLD